MPKYERTTGLPLLLLWTFCFMENLIINLENEVWKDIPNYEGYYQVSNFGRVKSLERKILVRNKHEGKINSRLLKPTDNNKGYLHVVLFKNSLKKTRKIHQLVAEAFFNHKPCGYELVVNHKDFNKINNTVDNLEIITQRENLSFKLQKHTSKYIGVSWSKSSKKWVAQIKINKKIINLGLFNNELEASNAYQQELLKLKGYGNITEISS